METFLQCLNRLQASTTKMNIETQVFVEIKNTQKAKSDLYF